MNKKEAEYQVDNIVERDNEVLIILRQNIGLLIIRLWNRK
jgi:hypothetical protein